MLIHLKEKKRNEEREIGKGIKKGRLLNNVWLLWGKNDFSRSCLVLFGSHKGCLRVIKIGNYGP